MGYLQFIAAFTILAGAAMLCAVLGKLTIGEGMIAAAALVMTFIYLCAYAGVLQAGFIVIGLLGVTGWVLRILQQKKGGDKSRKSPYLPACLLAVFFFLVVYRGDYIQRIDELHLWAPVVRSILRTHTLIFPDGLYVGNQLLGTSMLHVFFLQFTGFQEAYLYVSGTMLIFMGALLPMDRLFVSDANGETKRKTVGIIVALYMLLIWAALYTCYYYGAKTIYVDMATAAWSGGLAGWWVCREKGKKSNVPVFLCGLLIVFCFKVFVGLVMDILLILWACSWSFFAEGRYYTMSTAVQRRFKRGIIAILLVGFAAAGMILLVPSIREMLFSRIGIVDVTTDKIKQTVVRFVTAVFGRSLSASGRIGLSFLPGMAFIGILTCAAADLSGNARQKKVSICYVILASAVYLVFLLTAFLLLFSYEEATVLAGIGRYLAIPLVYMLILAVTLLIREWVNGKGISARTAEYAVLMTAALFALNMNEGFIPSMTGIDKSRVSGYADIHETKKEIQQIQQIIDSHDRVYLLNQVGETEFPVNLAWFYLENQVSNYLSEPWKYAAKGATIRLKVMEEYQLEDFPQLLRDRGYTYLWIYTTDKYLTSNLEQVFNMENEPENGQLYKMEYSEGEEKPYLVWVDDLTK